MNEVILRHLAELYGPRAAADAAPRLEQLLACFRGKSVGSSSSPGRRVLTQRDALLITYADQVRAPEQTPLAALADFARSHLRDVVSGIHLLPFYPWSSDDGFSVKDYFAVDPDYGTWEDIRGLSAEFDLMFDAVFNHLSAQSEWFQRFLGGDEGFRDYFVTVQGDPDLSQVVRPRALPLLTAFETVSGPRKVWTTFSADQVDLNVRNPEVLLSLLEALLFYVSNGARFVRLDAIAFLWKEVGTSCLHLPQTHRIIQLMRAVLDDVAPGVLLITETNVPHHDNISYFGEGVNEAQLVYNFALPPLVLHSLQTGNAEGLTSWAQSLALPGPHVTFFNFLASHDGIGLNPARGILTEEEIDALVVRTLEHGGFISYKSMPDGSRSPYEMNINYLDALSNPSAHETADLAARKFLTAQAIMLSLQGMPGIYFHSLFGSRGDRAGAESSGIPRRINREKFDRARLEAALLDGASLRALVFRGYCELLRVRREHAVFAPTAPQRVLPVDPRIFALARESVDGSDFVLCLHNVHSANLAVDPRFAGLPSAGRWEDLLAGPRDAGSGAVIELGPFETRWLISRR